MDKIEQFLSLADVPLQSSLSVPNLLKALRDTNGDLAEVVQLINFDPALTARVLQSCNSAQFARSEPVSDLTGAVNRLGYRNIFRVVATVKGSQLFQVGEGAQSVDRTKLWRHSVGAAFAAQFIAGDYGMDMGTYFTAGLLHDLGKFVLAEVYPDEYAEVLQQAGEAGCGLAEQEKARFGHSHAEVGARLLARWKFPTELVNDICHHHHPTASDMRQQAAVVCLADYLSHVNDSPEQPPMPCAEVESALELLGLSIDAAQRYMDLIQENVQFVEAMYQMGG